MEFIAMARRSGQEWFIGCLTNENPRELELSLDVLGSGKYVAEVYADADDAATEPKHTAIRRQDVDRATKLRLRLAPGGGAAVRIGPESEPAITSGSASSPPRRLPR
jgi:alpha-glucosidase